MKVLMIGNDSSVKGGITSVITQLLKYDWSKDGIEMSFIPSYVETNAISKILFFLKSVISINKKLHSNKPDVVHIHMSYKGSFTRKHFIYKMCKKQNVPVVIHLHGSEFKKWYDSCDGKKQGIIREFLKGSDAFIVLGENWESSIKAIEPETKVVVVNNTINIPDETISWNKPLKILFMGVLIERKGVVDLLKAIDLLKKNYGVSNCKFVVAGTGAEEERLKNMCSELELNSMVEFAGWVSGDKKTELYKECQMMVLPSYNEGLPIAILEAISFGMPVIATDVGDISSAVIDGSNGYLIKPGDYTKLAECINNIVSDKERFLSMSDSSRKLAEDNFSENDYFKTMNDLYKKVTNK